MEPWYQLQQAGRLRYGILRGLPLREVRFLALLRERLSELMPPQDATAKVERRRKHFATTLQRATPPLQNYLRYF